MTTTKAPKKEKIVGWINPEGELIECQSMVIENHRHLYTNKEPEHHGEIDRSDLD